MSGASTTPLVALTIAGSDSSAGAGIEADLKTFAAHELFGTVAITAVTAQNTTGVTAVQAMPAAMVIDQIDAVLGDFSIAATKTGMLATIDIIEAVADFAARDALPLLVVDPVMIATSGAALLEPGATAAYRSLLAHATVTTPNLAEAEALLERPVRNLAQMRDAAKALADLGVRCAVVKGGHLQGPRAIDVVFVDGEIHELTAVRIVSRNTHGTGCTLSAAIASRLAVGHGMLEAISLAKSYVHDAISTSATWQLGKGPGPLAHRRADLD